MNISVIGCGRWGTFLAQYAHQLGHAVWLYGRRDSKHMEQLKKNGKNEYLALSDQITLSDRLDETIHRSEIVLVSIGAQNLRNFAKELKMLDHHGRVYVLCMKGLENDTGKRLSQVFIEETRLEKQVGVWVGPGHVQDFLKQIPNCMVVSSAHKKVTEKVVDALSSDLIRFYYGEDFLGVEIGAAAKNVMGIASGMLDGLGYGALKGALMARGAREVSRLVKAMGGQEITVYGLSHLGDYEATLFSPYSHNRQYGQCYIEQKPMDQLAEGVETAKALVKLANDHEVDMPISEGVYQILHLKQSPKEVLLNMFVRPLKYEFDE